MRVRDRVAAVAAFCLVLLIAPVGAQSDERIILQFQRAADSYAFASRQADRGGPPPVMLEEGLMFTPTVSAVLRARIAVAMRTSDCVAEPQSDNFVVPRVRESASATQPLAACLVPVLPKLPVELEYRTAGVTLVLVDAKRQLVVDVLHGAFPVSSQ